MKVQYVLDQAGKKEYGPTSHILFYSKGFVGIVYSSMYKKSKKKTQHNRPHNLSFSPNNILAHLPLLTRRPTHDIGAQFWHEKGASKPGAPARRARVADPPRRPTHEILLRFPKSATPRRPGPTPTPSTSSFLVPKSEP